MKKIFACLLIMMLCACAETSYQYEKQEVLPTIELNMRLIENDQNVVSTRKEDTFNEEELLYGNIICKCNLVDCVYMTEDFIEAEKKKDYNNFISGHYKVGRYAWVLEDVEIIKPIPVKGQLGIWNYNI